MIRNPNSPEVPNIPFRRENGSALLFIFVTTGSHCTYLGNVDAKNGWWRFGGSGPGGIFNIGKSRATLFDKGTKVNITFADVAGSMRQGRGYGDR
jgi:cell division protease FtsH